MSSPLRIGIIGAGGNTRDKHIPGFQEIDGVEIVVVCNRSQESSRRVAERFGIPRIVEDWREVVKDSEVDAICIGTWPYLHAPATIAALEHGKHVLTEARMAASLDEARDMLAAAEKAEGLVAQIVPSPFTLSYDGTVRRLLQDGHLGELREVHVSHTMPAYASSETPMNWRLDRELSGINALTVGIYHEAVQRWLEQEPVFVRAEGATYIPERSYEDETRKRVELPESLSILGQYGGGARLVYQFSGIESGRGRNEAILIGSKATLRIDIAKGELWWAESGSTDETRVEIDEATRQGWQVEADFVRSIRDGMPVTRTSFAQGVRYMAFSDAVFRSWKAQGERVDLEVQ